MQSLNESERKAAMFNTRGNNLYVVYIFMIALVDISALLQLIPHVPVWCHILITFSLSIVALVAVAMSVRMKHKHGNARTKTILELLNDVARLSRAK